MDFGPLRALALDLNVTAHGVPATVTRPAPDDAPITTRVIWLTATTAETGFELKRREQRRVLALKRSDVATLPQKTRIAAPLTATGTVQTWRIEVVDTIEADQWRAIVVAEPE